MIQWISMKSTKELFYNKLPGFAWAKVEPGKNQIPNIK
jgi:hypothetical protein